MFKDWLFLVIPLTVFRLGFVFYDVLRTRRHSLLYIDPLFYFIYSTVLCPFNENHT